MLDLTVMSVLNMLTGGWASPLYLLYLGWAVALIGEVSTLSRLSLTAIAGIMFALGCLLILHFTPLSMQIMIITEHLLLLLAHLVGTSWREPLSDFGALLLATLLALVGLCMVVHFGIVTVTAGMWRWFGFDCRPIMRTPLAARSLGEFWSRRWNIAFAEMTGLAVARPLAPLLGKNAAVFAAFLASGVLHELAISVPVRAGYGLPLLYFVLHGALVLTERHLERIGWPIDRAGWLAHVWTIGWLLVPLPILFHPYFIQGVVWPLIGIERY